MKNIFLDDNRNYFPCKLNIVLKMMSLPKLVKYKNYLRCTPGHPFVFIFILSCFDSRKRNARHSEEPSDAESSTTWKTADNSVP